MKITSALFAVFLGVAIITLSMCRADNSPNTQSIFANNTEEADSSETDQDGLSILGISESESVGTASDRSEGESHLAQSISLEIQQLAGISLGPFRSLDEKYRSLEVEAAGNPRASLEAAELREMCTFFGAINYEDETNTPIDMAELIAECRFIEENAQYRTWELIEWAAEAGVRDAILKQPSFPPSYGGLKEKELVEALGRWQNTVLLRIQSLADSGDQYAALRAARLLAGEFPSLTDRESALAYLDMYFDQPGLGHYEDALATRLRRQLSMRRPATN